MQVRVALEQVGQRGAEYVTRSIGSSLNNFDALHRQLNLPQDGGRVALVAGGTDHWFGGRRRSCAARSGSSALPSTSTVKALDTRAAALQSLAPASL
jgi:hypothetical protein